MTLGFIELTTNEGAALWLVAGSIFAIEKSPNENFTFVKTPSGDFGVMEAPQVILDLMEKMMEEETFPFSGQCEECGMLDDEDHADWCSLHPDNFIGDPDD